MLGLLFLRLLRTPPQTPPSATSYPAHRRSECGWLTRGPCRFNVGRGGRGVAGGLADDPRGVEVRVWVVLVVASHVRVVPRRGSIVIESGNG